MEQAVNLGTALIFGIVAMVIITLQNYFIVLLSKRQRYLKNRVDQSADYVATLKDKLLDLYAGLNKDLEKVSNEVALLKKDSRITTDILATLNEKVDKELVVKTSNVMAIKNYIIGREEYTEAISSLSEEIEELLCGLLQMELK